MIDLDFVSSQTLADRRQVLRRQRRRRNLQRIWRSFAISGMAAGTLWLATQPVWVLRSSEQIAVEGNELLSDEAVRSLLPLDYPQRLLQIEPDQVAQALQTQSPVASAKVIRQLFPPRLEIHVQERYPVAVTIPTHPQPLDKTANYTPKGQPGLLDSQGNWMAQSSFSTVAPEIQLPTLKVKGFDNGYQAQWISLYQALQASSVAILEVDWQVPSNVILHTQLGTVHLGIYDPQIIQEQVALLAQLRSLTSANNLPEVEYIDLSNPKVPTVKTITALK